MYAAALVDRDQFFSTKPATATNFNWLFNAANPGRLPDWCRDLIDLIDRRSINAPNRVTFFYQQYLIEQLDKSERAIRYGLRLLERFGVITTKRDRQNRHSINLEFFDPITQPPPPAPPPKPDLCKKVAGEVAGESSGINKEEVYRSRKSIIKSPSQARGDDKETNLIVQTFEQITGVQFQSGRDGATLQALRSQFNPTIIILGVLLSALRLAMARPGAKINSLAYCRAAIVEISRSGIKDPGGYYHYLKRKARQILGIDLL